MVRKTNELQINTRRRKVYKEIAVEKDAANYNWVQR